VSLYGTSSPHVEVGQRVATKLAAFSDLLGFFGSRIGLVAQNEMDYTIPESLLAVIASEGTNQRQVGGDIEADFPVTVRAILPAPTPATQAIAIPAAPTAAPVGSAAAASFRLTEFGDRGESYAGAIVVSTNGATLTLPALSGAGKGFRIWRTKGTSTQFRWAGTARAASAWIDHVTDARLGDELAPDWNQIGEQIRTAVARALFGRDNETLPKDGTYATYCNLIGKRIEPKVNNRNLWIFDFVLTYQSRYDPTTGALKAT
jgi:hypothetical protein